MLADSRRARGLRPLSHPALRPQLVVLSGASGALLWEVSMLPGPECPPPASVLTLNSVSVFMFWGLLPPAGNRSVSSHQRSESGFKLGVVAGYLNQLKPA